MSIDLKPCPFCSGPGSAHKALGFIECENCGAAVGQGDLNLAVNRWNTRQEAAKSAEQPVSLKDGGESVRQFFDLSLVGPDCGFKPEDVARIIAEKWGLKHVD